MLPIVKDHIPHQGLDILEKRLAPRQHATQYGVLIIAPLQDGVEQEGQQIETEQKRREVLLAVTKVVLQMVALGLEYVVVFVFDLPPPPAHVCNVPNVVRRQAMIGNTAIVIELLARLGVADGDLKPIDGQGRVPTAQEHVVEVAH